MQIAANTAGTLRIGVPLDVNGKGYDDNGYPVTTADFLVNGSAINADNGSTIATDGNNCVVWSYTSGDMAYPGTVQITVATTGYAMQPCNLDVGGSTLDAAAILAAAASTPINAMTMGLNGSLFAAEQNTGSMAGSFQAGLDHPSLAGSGWGEPVARTHMPFQIGGSVACAGLYRPVSDSTNGRLNWTGPTGYSCWSTDGVTWVVSNSVIYTTGANYWEATVGRDMPYGLPFAPHGSATGTFTVLPVAGAVDPSGGNAGAAAITAAAGTTIPSLASGAIAQETANTGKLQFDVLTGGINALKTTCYGFLGALLSGTNTWIVGAFKNFFNIQTPTGTVNSLPAATPGTSGSLATQNANGDVSAYLDSNKGWGGSALPTEFEASNLPEDYLSSDEQTLLNNAEAYAESANGFASTAASQALSAATSAATAAAAVTSETSGNPALLTAIQAVSGGGGLTPQQVRDALTLATTNTSPASGSVDAELANIATQIGSLTGRGGGFTCTVQTNDSSTPANPVPGVTVYAMSAASGGTLVGGPAVSNSGGAATIILQEGTQWIWQLRSGYSTPAPTQVTITAAATITLTSLVPFVPPSVGTYAALGDLQNIFGVPNIIKWAILSANDPDLPAGQAEITNRVNWAIGVATVIFENSMRQGPYALPIRGPGASIWATTVVSILAGEWLYIHSRHAQRGPDGKIIFSDYEGERTWAQEQMDFARSNKIRLDAVLSGKGTNAPMVTHDRERGAYGPGQVGYGTRALPPPGPFVG